MSPEEPDSAVTGTIRRDEIEAADQETVAIFPTKKSGIEFIEENNAWGFVTIARRPEYIAMYVAGDLAEVRYFATVKDIVRANEASLKRDAEQYDQYDATKMVVKFEPDSLYQLEDPIPYGEKTPYSLRYTDIKTFKTGESTDDLF